MIEEKKVEFFLIENFEKEWLWKNVDEIFSCNQSTPNHSLVIRDWNKKTWKKKSIVESVN